MEFCKTTKVNKKYCSCKKCKKAIIKKGPEDQATLKRQLPALGSREYEVKISVNVYMNYESAGHTGMEIFQKDLEGLALPEFKENNAKAKYNESGILVSPYYAWQATISLQAGDPAIDEIKAIYGEDKAKKGKNGEVLVHSNAIAKTLLALR